MRPKQVHPWKASEIKQLGKVPDSVLARRLKTSIRDVVSQCEARGISAPAEKQKLHPEFHNVTYP